MTTIYEYAPVNGYFVKLVDGVAVEFMTTDSYQKALSEFFALKNSGQLKLLSDSRQFHSLFHGHCGRIMTYELSQ